MWTYTLLPVSIVCSTVQYSTVIGTLAVDGWAVTFGTARRGLGGCGPPQSPPRCTKCRITRTITVLTFNTQRCQR